MRGEMLSKYLRVKKERYKPFLFSYFSPPISFSYEVLSLSFRPAAHG